MSDSTNNGSEKTLQRRETALERIREIAAFANDDRIYRSVKHDDLLEVMKKYDELENVAMNAVLMLSILAKIHAIALLKGSEEIQRDSTIFKEIEDVLSTHYKLHSPV